MPIPSIRIPSSLKLPKLKRNRQSNASPAAKRRFPSWPWKKPKQPPPPPYDFSERIKALFEESPRKKTPGVPIRRRKGRLAKLRRGIARAVGSYFIRLSPRTQYRRPRVRTRTRVAAKFKKIGSHASKYVDGASHKVKALGDKLKSVDVSELYKRYIKRDPNAIHGMEYDVFVDFVDTALGDLHASQEREDQRREEEAAERERELFACDVRRRGGQTEFPELSGRGNAGGSRLTSGNQGGTRDGRYSFDWDFGEDIYRVL